MLDGGENGNYLPIGTNCQGQLVPVDLKELSGCHHYMRHRGAHPKHPTANANLTMHSNSPVQFSSNLVDALQSNSEVSTTRLRAIP